MFLTSFFHVLFFVLQVFNFVVFDSDDFCQFFLWAKNTWKHVTFDPQGVDLEGHLLWHWRLKCDLLPLDGQSQRERAFRWGPVTGPWYTPVESTGDRKQKILVMKLFFVFLSDGRVWKDVCGIGLVRVNLLLLWICCSKIQRFKPAFAVVGGKPYIGPYIVCRFR